MTEPARPVSVVATKIESLDGKSAVSVRIKNPHGNTDFEMEIMVEKVDDPSRILELARLKIYQFANDLLDRIGDKGSLHFG